MAIRGVLRIGEVAVRVLDLEAAAVHYGRHIGLQEVLREAGRIYFKAWDEHDHHSVVLREADTAGARLFRLQGVRRRDAHGARSAHPGVRCGGGTHRRGDLPAQRTADPVQAAGRSPDAALCGQGSHRNSMPTRNPGVLPDDGVIRGMGPTRLDHVLLAAPMSPRPPASFSTCSISISGRNCSTTTAVCNSARSCAAPTSPMTSRS